MLKRISSRVRHASFRTRLTALIAAAFMVGALLLMVGQFGIVHVSLNTTVGTSHWVTLGDGATVLRDDAGALGGVLPGYMGGVTPDDVVAPDAVGFGPDDVDSLTDSVIAFSTTTLDEGELRVTIDQLLASKGRFPRKSPATC